MQIPVRTARNDFRRKAVSHDPREFSLHILCHTGIGKIAVICQFRAGADDIVNRFYEDFIAVNLKYYKLFKYFIKQNRIFFDFWLFLYTVPTFFFRQGQNKGGHAH